MDKQYNKNDFLYYAYGDKAPQSCNGNTSIFSDLQSALCQNKKYADNIIAKTSTHTGSNERYNNIQAFTDTSMLNLFNLGIGIVVAAVFISKLYK